jgi:hypothetical protein
MAEFLILIYDDESAWAAADEQEGQEVIDGHRRFFERHGAAFRGGNRLRGTDTATSIRHDRDGNVTVTDGPFAETKEALGGYYVIEAADLDEALAIARDVPAKYGGVEVRPVWPAED